MMRRKSRTLRVGLALLALLALSSLTYAEDAPPADKWTFAVRPYLWAPGISGTLKYDIPPTGDGAANVDFASYILQNLNFALMLTAEARKGDWSVLTDVVYLDVESDDTNVKSVSFAGPGGRIEVSAGADLGTTAKLSGVLWELAGAYTVARGGNSSLDVLAGFRLLRIKAETDWLLSGSITDNVSGRDLRPFRQRLANGNPLGRDRRCPRQGGSGRQQVGHPVLPRRGHGRLGADVAGSGGHRVPVRLGGSATVVSPPVLRHEGRQAAAERQPLRARPRRELPLLTGRTTGGNSLPPAKPWKQGANRIGDGFPLRSVVPIVVIRKNQEE